MALEKSKTLITAEKMGGLLKAINNGVRRFDRIFVDLPAYISTPLMGHNTICATLVQLGKGGGLLESRTFMGTGRVITLDIAIDKHAGTSLLGGWWLGIRHVRRHHGRHDARMNTLDILGGRSRRRRRRCSRGTTGGDK